MSRTSYFVAWRRAERSWWAHFTPILFLARRPVEDVRQMVWMIGLWWIHVTHILFFARRPAEDVRHMVWIIGLRWAHVTHILFFARRPAEDPIGTPLMHCNLQHIRSFHQWILRIVYFFILDPKRSPYWRLQEMKEEEQKTCWRKFEELSSRLNGFWGSSPRTN